MPGATGWYSDGGVCAAPPDTTPVPSPPPVYFGSITASQLQAIDATEFPNSDPGVNTQIYLMSGQGTISSGPAQPGQGILVPPAASRTAFASASNRTTVVFR
jgi:hypothetical protein